LKRRARENMPLILEKCSLGIVRETKTHIYCITPIPIAHKGTKQDCIAVDRARGYWTPDGVRGRVQDEQGTVIGLVAQAHGVSFQSACKTVADILGVPFAWRRRKAGKRRPRPLSCVGAAAKTLALEAAALGIRVFPLTSRRIPAIKGWQAKATTDPRQIDAWHGRWNSGLVGTPDFDVIDIDTPVDGRADGFATLAALETEHGPLPIGPRTRTSRGGRHVFVETPDGLRTRAPSLGAGIDTRGRGTGYVVLPGSRARDGRAWTLEDGWVLADLLTKIPVAPDWVIAGAGRRSPDGASETSRETTAAEVGPLDDAYPGEITDAHIRHYVREKFREKMDFVQNAGVGTRNSILNASTYSVGRLLAQTTLSDAMVTKWLLEAAVACGLVRDDGARAARATIRDALGRGRRDGLSGASLRKGIGWALRRNPVQLEGVVCARTHPRREAPVVDLDAPPGPWARQAIAARSKNATKQFRDVVRCLDTYGAAFGGRFIVGTPALSRQSGVPKRTVIRHVDWLKKNGLLRTYLRFQEGWQKASTYYLICPEVNKAKTNEYLTPLINQHSGGSVEAFAVPGFDPAPTKESRAVLEAVRKLTPHQREVAGKRDPWRFDGAEFSTFGRPRSNGLFFVIQLPPLNHLGRRYAPGQINAVSPDGVICTTTVPVHLLREPLGLAVAVLRVLKPGLARPLLDVPPIGKCPGLTRPERAALRAIFDASRRGEMRALVEEHRGMLELLPAELRRHVEALIIRHDAAIAGTKARAVNGRHRWRRHIVELGLGDTAGRIRLADLALVVTGEVARSRKTLEVLGDILCELGWRRGSCDDLYERPGARIPTFMAHYDPEAAPGEAPWRLGARGDGVTKS